MRRVVFVFVCSRARVIKRSICVRNNFFCVAGKFRYEKYEASKKDIFALWCSFLDKKLFLLPDDPIYPSISVSELLVRTHSPRVLFFPLAENTHTKI